jgi:hypothetical protein
MRQYRGMTKRIAEGALVAFLVLAATAHTLSAADDHAVDGSAIARDVTVPAASLVGRFLYTGPPPERKPLTFTWAYRNRDGTGTVVEAANAPQLIALGLKDESLIVGADGGIANVVIWLRGKGLPPNPPPRPLPPIKVLAEPGRFEPHVRVFWLARHLELVNDMDETTNINLQAVNNPFVNPLLKPGGRIEYGARWAEPVPVRLSSNIHPWMGAFLLPLDHPYFAITDEDGRFEIPTVPVGAWDFVMWHERTGWLASDRYPTGQSKLAIESGINALGDMHVAAEAISGRRVASPGR